MQNFPQTKLDKGINSPFLLNEHGDTRFCFQVFGKNTQIKTYLKKKKILIGENDFFRKIVSYWVYFGHAEDF